jgi:uncharacterized damage-inducible protein DinB
MNSGEKTKLIVESYGSEELEIGRWLWALQDTRKRTLEALEQVPPELLDWLSGSGQSSIGTVLYHIADIEADWLYAEVLERSIPREVTALFPFPIRDKGGRLTQVTGFGLQEHLDRLETVRGLLLDAFAEMGLTDFGRVRLLPPYDVTPEWVLDHLMQHEAEHCSQIVRTLRAGAPPRS